MHMTNGTKTVFQTANKIESSLPFAFLVTLIILFVNIDSVLRILIRDSGVYD